MRQAITLAWFRVFRALVCTIAALLAIVGTSQPAAATAKLYGAAHTGGPRAPSTLYRIDPATGSSVAVGPIGFNAVGGIGFHPTTGVLYGAAKRSSDQVSVLVEIDPTTGAGTEIGPTGIGAFGFGENVSDISFRPSDGTLFAYIEPDDGVVTIDPTTGAASLVGGPANPPGCCGSGIGFDPVDVLYHVDDGGVSTLDQSTGLSTPGPTLTYVGFPSLSDFPRPNAMEFNPDDGAPYVSVNDGSGGQGPNYLAILDPITGDVNHIGRSVNGLDTLAWEPAPFEPCGVSLYGVGHTGGPTAPTQFYSVNPSTGVAVGIGAVGFNAVGGIDVDPMTGLLFGIGERPADGVNVLITIDPATGLGTEIGPTGIEGFGFGVRVSDVSFRTSDGVFFAYVEQGDGLFTIDPATGAASLVGGPASPTGCCGSGIGFSAANVLYHADDVGFSSLDQSLGTAAHLGGLSFVGFPALTNPRPNSIDFDPAFDVAFVTVNDGEQGTGPNYLATLDVVTGDITNVGLSANGLDGLAWVADCDDADPCTVDQCLSPVTECALFGAAHTGGPASPSTLYHIDPRTGSALPVGPVGFDKVGGLDFQPVTGTLFGVARRASDEVDVLITVDPQTGSGTEVGPLVNTLAAGGSHFDLSFRNYDGRLFLTAFSPINECVSLFEVDPATGLATEIGDTTTCGPGNALGFSPDDTLYLVLGDAGEGLYTVDEQTGTATLSAALGYLGFPPLARPRTNAMDVDPCAGLTFISVNDGSGGTGPNYLATLETATGEIQHVGSSVDGLTALAWRPASPGQGACLHDPLPDSDGDGVCDEFDNCPQIPNPDQGPAPLGQTLLVLPTKQDFDWSAVLDVEWVRGDFVVAADIGSYAWTLDVTLTGATFNDPTTPVLDEGLWYLVKPDCPAGSWTSIRQTVARVTND
jgi:hypothetical protein